MSEMRLSRWAFASAVAVSALWSCIDATDVELLEIGATGVIVGQAFLDGNGNGALDAGDQPLANATVVLNASGTQGAVDQSTTDAIGAFTFLDIAPGTYTLGIGGAVLGDSLETLGATSSVTIEHGDTVAFAVGASYPVLTLEEVRAAAAGRRVFTSGIGLNPRQPNGDGMVFFKGPTAYLRATNVDRVGMGPGDSIRLLGRTAVDNGQPTLDAVTPFVLISQAQFPIPVEVTTAAARTANGGVLDAALVRIRNADITDTATVANDFYFWTHSGGDSVQVVFRAFLGIPTAPVRPDTIVRVSQATGMLSPFDDGSGNVRWRLLVRAGSEIVYEIKQADVGVTTSFDTAQATTATDTVEIRVTVQNAGPLTATGVSVTDTIPAALTYVSSTATRGSYDPATRIWTVGDLAAGAVADTLRILAEVTGAPGVVANTARLRPLTREQEVNAANNVATTSPGLTINP